MSFFLLIFAIRKGKKMKTIYIKQTIKPNSGVHYEVVEAKGRKFLIHINACNSDPCGFNSYCCLSIMTADGPWGHVVDNKMIGIPFDRNDIVYGHKSDIEKRNILSKIALNFRDYIEKVY